MKNELASHSWRCTLQNTHEAPRLHRMCVEYWVKSAADPVLFMGITFMYKNKMNRKIVKGELKPYSDYLINKSVLILKKIKVALAVKYSFSLGHNGQKTTGKGNKTVGLIWMSKHVMPITRQMKSITTGFKVLPSESLWCAAWWTPFFVYFMD